MIQNLKKVSDGMKRKTFMHIFSSVLILTFIGLVVYVSIQSERRVEAELRPIGTHKTFINIVEDYRERQERLFNFAMKGNEIAEDMADADPQYSKTNTQVKGIDEEDVVKTDGTYIYSISQNRLLVTKAYPVEEVGLEKEVIFEEGFYARGLYVTEDHVLVLGTKYPVVKEETKAKMAPEEFAIYESRVDTAVRVFTKGDYEAPLHTYLFKGYLHTSRLKEDSLLLIVDNYLPYEVKEKKASEILPDYSIDGERVQIGFNEIYYQEGTDPQGLVSIYQVELSHRAVEHFSYLGSSQTVYVSPLNIYLANNIYNDSIGGMMTDVFDSRRNRSGEVVISKINYSNGLSYEGSVKTSGTIYSQFMMDEYEGHFRVVTSQSSFGFTEDTSQNNLYIYDEDLKKTGEVTGLAKGETIQSSRFVGDRIYLVTYRVVDPFFVIDASDPKDPKVLGELKIPGYSSYLHPYDEHHVLGFGFEGDESGFNTGLKVALYDVRDPHNPVEEFKTTMLFENNTYYHSSVTFNHKALLFSRDKNIIGFPLSKYTYKEHTSNGTITVTNHYEQEYAIYRLDLANGFEKAGSITHFNDEVTQNLSYLYQIDRGLYIEDYLYTVSDREIQIHDLTTFEEIDRVILPYAENDGHYTPYPVY